MGLELVYQRWLEIEGGAPPSPPLWFWPVGLDDGRTLLTLLWREGSGGEMRTVILELSAEGALQVWGPGAGYPAPVIVCALANGDLVGLDLVKRGKLYACRMDGTHCWTAGVENGIEQLGIPAAGSGAVFPQRHVCGDRLYVMEFDTSARISVYAARG